MCWKILVPRDDIMTQFVCGFQLFSTWLLFFCIATLGKGGERFWTFFCVGCFLWEDFARKPEVCFAAVMKSSIWIWVERAHQHPNPFPMLNTCTVGNYFKNQQWLWYGIFGGKVLYRRLKIFEIQGILSPGIETFLDLEFFLFWVLGELA